MEIATSEEIIMQEKNLVKMFEDKEEWTLEVDNFLKQKWIKIDEGMMFALNQYDEMMKKLSETSKDVKE